MRVTETASGSSRARTAIASLLRSLSEQREDITAPGLVNEAVTDGARVTGSVSCAQPSGCALPSVAQELEVERLRRERDVAVQQEQAVLRRERDAAVAEAQRRSSELESAAAELAALREAHAVAAAQAKHAAAASFKDVASKAEALERALATNAELTAAGAQQKLRIEALETKQAVLLECFQALEAELMQRRNHRASGAGHRQGPLPQLPAPLPANQCVADVSNKMAIRPGRDLVWALDSNGHGSDLLPPGSLMAMAARCAELQCQLSQQQRQADAARKAAVAAEEQAAGLRLLLARQAGVGGSSGSGPVASTEAVGRRLEAACEQLQEARRVEVELRQLLAQARGGQGME